MGRRQKSPPTRLEFVGPMVRGLKEFGYPNVTAEQLKEALEAWLAGKRGHDLPHGVIGYVAGRNFDELEEAQPGALARLAE